MNAYRKQCREADPPKQTDDLEDCPTLSSGGDTFAAGELELDLESEENIDIPPAIPIIHSTVRPKGGRVKDETEQKEKRQLAEAILAAKNEITQLYLEKMKVIKKSKTPGIRVTKEGLQAIIDEVKERRNLPSGFSMPHCAIRKRVQRGEIFSAHRGHVNAQCSYARNERKKLIHDIMTDEHFPEEPAEAIVPPFKRELGDSSHDDEDVKREDWTEGREDAVDRADDVENKNENCDGIGDGGVSPPPPKKANRTRQRFTTDFKMAVIAQVRESGQNVASVARSHGLNESTVRSFAKNEDKIADLANKNLVLKKANPKLRLHEVYRILDRLYETNWGATSRRSNDGVGVGAADPIPTNHSVITAHAELVRDLLLKRHAEEPFLPESELSAIQVFKAKPQWARAYAKSHKWKMSSLRGEPADEATFKIFERIKHVRETFGDYYPLVKDIVDVTRRGNPLFNAARSASDRPDCGSDDGARIEHERGVEAEGGDNDDEADGKTETRKPQLRMTHDRFRTLEAQLRNVKSELAACGDAYASAAEKTDEVIERLRRTCKRRGTGPRSLTEKRDGKFRRKRLTLEEKMDVIDMVKDHGSNTAVANLLEVNESTVRSITKMEDSIRMKCEAQKIGNVKRTKRRRIERQPPPEKHDGKFRRKRLTLEEKMDVINKVTEHGSNTAVANLFEVNESTVRSIVKMKDSIRTKWEVQKIVSADV